jgi:hypothetical protein
MNFVKGEMKVSCVKCMKEYIITVFDTEFINNYYSERRKGPESGYRWNHRMNCKCGNVMEIDYQVSEYPEGVFYNDNIYVKNGKLLNKFEYDF